MGKKLTSLPPALMLDGDDLLPVAKDNGDGTFTSKQLKAAGMIAHDRCVSSGLWADLVDALESGEYKNVVVKGQYTCSDNEPNPLNVHSNVQSITGVDCVINADCNTNDQITDFISLPDSTTVKNIGVKNIGIGTSVCNAFKGTDTNEEAKITRCEDCFVEGLFDGQATGFRYCTTINCQVRNADSVGVNGVGFGFFSCQGVIGCQTAYVSTSFAYCSQVVSCQAQYSTSSFVDCKQMAGCYVNYAFRGIWNCQRVVGCYVQGAHYAYLNSTNLSYTNEAEGSFGVDFEGCSFTPSVYKDAYDNTREWEFDGINISSGAKRTYELPDTDGKVALMNAQVNSGFFSVNNVEHQYGDDGIIFKNNRRYATFDPFIHDFNYGDNGTVTTDGENLFVGAGAGNLTTGQNATVSYYSSYNLSVGAGAMQAVDNGYLNTAVGAYSLYYFTNGWNNLALGCATMMNLTEGSGNVAVSSYGMYNLIDGNYNTAIGDRALANQAHKDGNVAIGMRAGYGLGSPVNCVAIGSNALGHWRDSSGLFDNEGCIAIGYNAGHHITENDMFIVDNRYRVTEARELTESLLVGKMADSPDDQWLKINGKLIFGQVADSEVTIPDGSTPAQIQEMIDNLPKNLNGSELRVVLPAETLTIDTPLLFNGIRNGYLRIYGANSVSGEAKDTVIKPSDSWQGTSGQPDDVNGMVGLISIYNCEKVSVRYIQFESNNGAARSVKCQGVEAKNHSYVHVYKNTFTGDGHSNNWCPALGMQACELYVVSNFIGGWIYGMYVESMSHLIALSNEPTTLGSNNDVWYCAGVSTGAYVDYLLESSPNSLTYTHEMLKMGTGGFFVQDMSSNVEPRITVSGTSVTLNAFNRYVSLDGSSAVASATLDPAPTDGQIVDINCVDLTNPCSVVGSLNGAASGSHAFSTQWDNIHLVYNADLSTWEIR